MHRTFKWFGFPVVDLVHVQGYSERRFMHTNPTLINVIVNDLLYIYIFKSNKYWEKDGDNI